MRKIAFIVACVLSLAVGSVAAGSDGDCGREPRAPRAPRGCKEMQPVCRCVENRDGCVLLGGCGLKCWWEFVCVPD